MAGVVRDDVAYNSVTACDERGRRHYRSFVMVMNDAAEAHHGAEEEHTRSLFETHRQAQEDLNDVRDHRLPSDRQSG